MAAVIAKKILKETAGNQFGVKVGGIHFYQCRLRNAMRCDAPNKLEHNPF